MKIKGQTFENDDVLLDGNSFEACTFKNCRMKYSGGAGVHMNDCQFIDVKWVFGGPAAATADFMRAMTTATGDYGRSMIVNTFPALKEWLSEEAKAKLLPGGE